MMIRPEAFVVCWEMSNCLADVISILGIDEREAMEAEAYYREAGVRLKEFRKRKLALDDTWPPMKALQI